MLICVRWYKEKVSSLRYLLKTILHESLPSAFLNNSLILKAALLVLKNDIQSCRMLLG